MALDALNKIREAEEKASRISMEAKVTAEKYIENTNLKCQETINEKIRLARKESEEILKAEKLSEENELKLLKEDFDTKYTTLNLLIKRNKEKGVERIIEYFLNGDENSENSII